MIDLFREITKLRKEVEAAVTVVTAAPVALANSQLRAYQVIGNSIRNGNVNEALEGVKQLLVPSASILVTGGRIEAMRSYAEILRQQAKDSWQVLPNHLVDILKKHYKIDFSKVRFASNITINPYNDEFIGITFEHDIFFKNAFDLNNKSDLSTLLHELEHVRQYEVHGGFEGFMTKYIVQSMGSGFAHDDIGLEKEAEDKAQRIIEEVANEFYNSSNLTHKK